MSDPTAARTVAIRGRAIASIASKGGLPTEIRTRLNGTATVTATGSACESGYAYSEFYTSTDFVTPSPLWATLAHTQRGPTYASIEIEPNDGPGGIGTWTGFDGSGKSTVLLPAGSYRTITYAGIEARTDKPSSRSAAGNVSITFAPIGSRVTGPKGKAKKQVKLPQAISCASGKATVKLGKKKQLKKVRAIQIKANKAKKKFNGKKIRAGATVNLPVPAAATGNLTAKVVFKNGKKQTVSATYRPCAA